MLNFLFSIMNNTHLSSINVFVFISVAIIIFLVVYIVLNKNFVTTKEAKDYVTHEFLKNYLHSFTGVYDLKLIEMSNDLRSSNRDVNNLRLESEKIRNEMVTTKQLDLIIEPLSKNMSELTTSFKELQHMIIDIFKDKKH